LRCQFGTSKLPRIISRDGPSANANTLRPSTSNRTKCTCSHPDHADASSSVNANILNHNLMTRTTRNAFHHHDVHASASANASIPIHTKSNYNIYISSPFEFPFLVLV
jgi:hypothetical protein